MIARTTKANPMRTKRSQPSQARATGDRTAVTIIPAPKRYVAAPTNRGQGTARGPENAGKSEVAARRALATQTPNPTRARRAGSTS